MSRRFIGGEAQRIANIIEYLSAKGKFRYNVVTCKIEYQEKDTNVFKELDDYYLNSLSRELGEADINCSPPQLDNILRSDITRRYDPFKDYMHSLTEWDCKTDYIEILSDTIKTTNPTFWRLCLKKWIVAMVGSLEDEHVVNHTVLILVGPQGSGKTTWIDRLVPAQLRKNHYYSGTINLGSKDTIIMLSESMLINLEELSSLTESQLNELKEIVTKKHIRLRRPYGRVNETLPRRASFTGSTNDKKILSDTSGSRRFLVFDVTRIDYQHSVDINMVYSQALSLYRQGFKFWFDENENQTINQNNEQYRAKSIEESLLIQTYSPADVEEDKEYLTATEILIELNRRYRIPISDASLQKLGKALRLHNFQRTKMSGKYVYAIRDREQGVISRIRRIS